MKKLNLFVGSLFVLYLLAQNNCLAQLTTSTAQTPQQLVQNVLVGSGVSTSNIVYTGSPDAIGSFDGSACNVGIDAGIILTTGTVLNTSGTGFQQGPFGPNDDGGSGMDNGQPGDPLLAAVSGNASFNAARLEFDFVPQSDSIKFNFVFGSEEYLEFVNAGVNDAFGFFISGPNPVGGNYADENIAIIPGTNLPVTIDNLNATANAAFYRDNGDGLTAPFNTSNAFIQYDGLTEVMTAKAQVVCGETYHIVIVISDIGDGILDSGVFLEEASFSSPGVNISSEISFQSNVGNDTTIVEGCGQADIWFVRTDSLAFEQTIPLSYSGSATNGVDMNFLPSTVVFPPGEDSVAIQIDATMDNLSEPLEFIQINVDLVSACGTTTDSLRLYIENVEPLEVTVSDEIVPCPNDFATLTSQVSHGTPGFTYLWNTGETTSQIDVSPAVTTVYTLTVTDTCGQTATTTATVTVPAFTPIQLTLSNDTTVNCLNAPVTLSAQSSGGGANHVITWENTSVSSTYDLNASATAYYSATVVDQCGNTTSDSVLVTLLEIPILTTISMDTLICPGEDVTLTVVPTGGVGDDYSFEWNTGATDSTIVVSPTSTNQYTVEVSDACGYVKAWDTVTVSVVSISANFTYSGLLEELADINFVNLSSGATSYEWDLGNGETSVQENPSTTYENAANYIVTLIATNDVGCVDSITRIIEIKPEFSVYVPNAFTPDGDEFNQTWQPIIVGHDPFDFDLYVYNRWGELIWESHDATVGWDGTYNGRTVPTGTYVWKMTVKLPLADDRREYIGSFTLLK